MPKSKRNLKCFNIYNWFKKNYNKNEGYTLVYKYNFIDKLLIWREMIKMIYNFKENNMFSKYLIG